MAEEKPLRVVARMLTPDEIAELRRVDGEHEAYARKAFAKTLTPEEKDALRKSAREQSDYARRAFRPVTTKVPPKDE